MKPLLTQSILSLGLALAIAPNFAYAGGAFTKPSSIKAIEQVQEALLKDLKFTTVQVAGSKCGQEGSLVTYEVQVEAPRYETDASGAVSLVGYDQVKSYQVGISLMGAGDATDLETCAK